MRFLTPLQWQVSDSLSASVMLSGSLGCTLKIGQASRFLWLCHLLAAKLVSPEVCRCQAAGLTQTPAWKV